MCVLHYRGVRLCKSNPAAKLAEAGAENAAETGCTCADAKLHACTVALLFWLLLVLIMFIWPFLAVDLSPFAPHSCR